MCIFISVHGIKSGISQSPRLKLAHFLGSALGARNTVIHFYFSADLISVISVQAFFKIIFRADGRLNDILLNKDVRHDVLSSLPRFQQFHSSVTKFCFETVSGKHALRQSNKQQRQSLETD